MPHKDTFDIGPLGVLIQQTITYAQGRFPRSDRVDPFARKHKYRKGLITNDINRSYRNTYHVDALEFLKLMRTSKVSLVLFDPPFSAHQAEKRYQLKNHEDVIAKSYFGQIDRITHYGALLVVCGWRSNVVSYLRAGWNEVFAMHVGHGSTHHDTNIMVLQKGPVRFKPQMPEPISRTKRIPHPRNLVQAATRLYSLEGSVAVSDGSRLPPTKNIILVPSRQNLYTVDRTKNVRVFTTILKRAARAMRKQGGVLVMVVPFSTGYPMKLGRNAQLQTYVMYKKGAADTYITANKF